MLLQFRAGHAFRRSLELPEAAALTLIPPFNVVAFLVHQTVGNSAENVRSPLVHSEVCSGAHEPGIGEGVTLQWVDTINARRKRMLNQRLIKSLKTGPNDPQLGN